MWLFVREPYYPLDYFLNIMVILYWNHFRMSFTIINFDQTNVSSTVWVDSNILLLFWCGFLLEENLLMEDKVVRVEDGEESFKYKGRDFDGFLWSCHELLLLFVSLYGSHLCEKSIPATRTRCLKKYMKTLIDPFRVVRKLDRLLMHSENVGVLKIHLQENLRIHDGQS